MASILIVDDEKSIRITLRAFLRKEGYSVDVAGTPDEALQKLRENPVDVVVCDIVLPGMNGVNLLQAIRRVTPNTQVVMMTGEPTVDTAIEALRAGAYDYLFKPIRKEAIVSVVNKAANLKAVDDERQRLLEENRRYQAELEQVVEQRTQALRETQEQLNHARKMEVAGQLAGGVAHDFNNLLMVIMNCAEFLRHGLPEDSPLCEDAEDLNQAAERAAYLTRQLLIFSRRETVERRPVQMSSILQTMKKMLNRLMPEDLVQDYQLGEDVGWIEADAGQMQQLVMNLAVNARDAMPLGGTLKIETRRVELQERDRDHLLEADEFDPGEYVLLAIGDTGTGIPADKLPRIFEPFYTTKEREKGTGMGLATVYGIVKQHGGFIKVETAQDQGTCFKIFFPRLTGGSGENDQCERQEIPGGNEGILVVEDDTQVRVMTCRMLERLGYRVLDAKDGGEALKRCDDHGDEIDLLLTDVVMPEKGGVAVAESIRARHPEIRVLFMSGYTEQRLSEYPLDENQCSLVHKPFTQEEIANQVRETLDQPAADQ